MAFFREDAYRVNGFDESFHGWGLDDSDFAVRMINSGVRIKSGRFSTGVFHLYHREGSLVKDSFNSSRFSKVIKDRLVNPLKGLAGKD
ncbi:MAG: galactosyltransferase-related protein [Duodenibacillus massiliensis]